MKLQPAQLYLPQDLYFRFKQAALLEGKSFASWSKDILLKEVKLVESKKKSFKALKKYSWADEDPRLSERIDETLYGST